MAWYCHPPRVLFQPIETLLPSHEVISFKLMSQFLQYDGVNIMCNIS